MSTTAPTAPYPPGPKGNLLFTARHELQHDMLGLLQRNVANYPGISRMKIGPNHFINVSDPVLVDKVFVDGEHFGKGKESLKMRFLLGMGLLTNEGKFWLKQRRLIQPLFHKQRLEGFVNSISDCTNEMLKDWDKETQHTLNVHGEMTKVTLGIVSRTLMSTDASGGFQQINEAVGSLMKGLTKRNRVLVALPYWVPTPENLKMKRDRKMLWDTVYRIISDRRKDTAPYDDLLSMLLEVEDADTGERMSDEQIKDEVVTIFLAGHETTANAMSFALYLLAQHPEARECIAAEYRIVVATEGSLNYQALAKLDYTTRVIKEAMRLYPPAWGILREVMQDATLGGYKVKKGDVVVLAPYAVHRMAEYWPNPEAFDPDRFIPERIKSQHKYTYFPFGGGARMCIGNNFAMMEMQILLALTCSQYSFSITPETKLELEPLITLRPKGKLVLGVKKEAQ